MDNFKTLPVKELKVRCNEQTGKYLAQKKYNPGYCYELFRRFFENNCDPALGAIYHIYKPIVGHWVKKHQFFLEIDAQEEEVILDSMSQFIFSLRRHPFQNFPSVARILAYWRKCVHTIIMINWRKQQQKSLNLESDFMITEEINYERQILKKEIWNRIKEVLPDSNDWLLSRLVYIYDMKPKQVSQKYPGIWHDANEVRVNKQKIKRCLQKDKHLLALLKEVNM